MTAVTLLGTLAISALASAGVEPAVPTGSSSSTTGTFSLHTLKAADPSQSPSELEYSVYLAPGLRKGEASPLILYLHGGGGSARQLEGMTAAIDEVTNTGELTPAIWSTPTAGRSFYMDYRDGSQNWESMIIKEYLPHLLRSYEVDRDHVYLMGTSMGGMGSLRMAFKYPEKFAGVAALEPAIEAAISWEDTLPLDTHYREDVYPAIFGSPVDADYWNANHPIAILAGAPARIREAGMSIYLEVGDEDVLLLYRGAEFLHRILFDEGIMHEYRLVRGANHIGNQFMALRTRDAMRFLGRAIDPIDEHLEDNPFVSRTRERTKDLGRGVPLPAHR